MRSHIRTIVWINLLAICTVPAIALAAVQCYQSVYSCEGSCGSSPKSCQQPPTRTTFSGFRVTSWQYVDRLCATFTVSESYDCDDDIGAGWAPVTGCDPGGGDCCKGTVDSRTWSFEGKIWLPATIKGCIQPGGPA